MFAIHRGLAVTTAVAIASLLATRLSPAIALATCALVACIACAMGWWWIVRSTPGRGNLTNYLAAMALAFRLDGPVETLKRSAMLNALIWTLLGGVVVAFVHRPGVPASVMSGLDRSVTLATFFCWMVQLVCLGWLIVDKLTRGYRGSTADRHTHRRIGLTLAGAAASVLLYANELRWLALIVSAVSVVIVVAPLIAFSLVMLLLGTGRKPVRWN